MCQIPVGTQTADEIIDKILALPEGTQALPDGAAGAARARRSTRRCATRFAAAGYVRMRVDGKSYSVDEPPAIDHRRKHAVEVVVDRVIVRGQPARRGSPTRWRRRWTWAAACCTSPMSTTTRPEPDWNVERFSQHFACDQLRPELRAAEPASLLVQQPARLVSHLRRAGRAARGQPGAADPRSAAVAAAGRPRRLAGADERTSRSRASPRRWPGTPASRWTRPSSNSSRHSNALILHGSGEAWIDAAIRAAEGEAAAGERALRFQYKGLFPAIDEAARVSLAYRQRLDHLVSEVPCCLPRLAAAAGRRRRGCASARIGRH